MSAVDRLTIVSHDKFQEIVDYANSADSVIRGGLKVVYVSDERSKVVITEPASASSRWITRFSSKNCTAANSTDS